ncbi:unnamed protein product, partial [Closterium sp. Naga37s-1]
SADRCPVGPPAAFSLLNAALSADPQPAICSQLPQCPLFRGAFAAAGCNFAYLAAGCNFAYLAAGCNFASTAECSFAYLQLSSRISDRVSLVSMPSLCLRLSPAQFASTLAFHTTLVEWRGGEGLN